MSSYPEHDRLRDVVNESQAIGEFLEWLETEGIHLAIYGEHDRLYTASEPMDRLLARFFKIDLNLIEAEKRSMLDQIRGLT